MNDLFLDQGIRQYFKVDDEILVNGLKFDPNNYMSIFTGVRTKY